ncbi:MAG: 2-oxoglutarate oxidoreductase [Armatimonadetes bacterium]|jgi:2-oxoglutarate ferredoxin oxidoreductase subunit beta|nr:2-oxoglutarate oxidoreductase [Armatimonadota bacterium]
MKKVFERPKSLRQAEFTYCPGCIHSIIHRMVAETMDELDITNRTIGVCPVGCAVFMYEYMNCDMIEAAHGRAPAVATGVKRVLPDKFVWAYQGDGDLASIGTAEIIHAAARGEKISVVFINNTTYGMTGGQMAPTTLVGQRGSTCPAGRDPEHTGYPIRVSEMLATLDAPSYIARVTPTSPAGLVKTKKAIKRAFENQLAGKAFSMVEVLSNCPTHWRMTPIESFKWIDENMTPVFPLGVFVDR